MAYVIKIYITANGKCPLSNWFDDLADTKAKVAIDLRLERVKMGNLGQCRSVGDKVFELKIDVGPGYRIYFAKIDTETILLLHAGDKRSQQKDIIRAKKYLSDFKHLEK